MENKILKIRVHEVIKIHDEVVMAVFHFLQPKPQLTPTPIFDFIFANPAISWAPCLARSPSKTELSLTKSKQLVF